MAFWASAQGPVDSRGPRLSQQTVKRRVEGGRPPTVTKVTAARVGVGATSGIYQSSTASRSRRSLATTFIWIDKAHYILKVNQRRLRALRQNSIYGAASPRRRARAPAASAHPIHLASPLARESGTSLLLTYLMSFTLIRTARRRAPVMRHIYV
ncbi:hypothetical protein EVAR_48714_1 [Eumeta japonica]|uniref:Uncharacterized protein n=1 Tax=Eumeta variegata TaxID=151549 RepID=A0A4C1XF32_EUMVA|nr:hypothetical protein EVAR_48714_1 [Eumeta japonica]